eukprot:GHRQ01006711.1.p1 GENE.GHRQ01006711.1~~GHRQ01006711.1.p1  ORF type:complete len:324 (+),score=160.03 GHRQ01006711.1:989-1960(+)
MQTASFSGMRSCAQRQPFSSGPAAVRPSSSSRPRSQHCCASWAASGLAGLSSKTFTRSFAPDGQQQARQQHSLSSQAKRARQLTVRAGWGDPVVFTAAKVVSNVKDAEKLHRVVVDVGDLAAGYSKGGQFMQIKVGEGKPGFFAIASPPDPNNQGLLEFLIKAQGEAAEALAGLEAGAEVAVSPVMGKGFSVDQIPADAHPTVLLFATGSGISPIKALIESGDLEADKRSDVRLYYGTRNAEHTAYADRIPAWEAAGVRVIQVFSNSDGQGAKYVQDVFSSDKGLSGGEGVGVVLCGQKEMCNAVKELVAAEGVDAAKVLLNF